MSGKKEDSEREIKQITSFMTYLYTSINTKGQLDRMFCFDGGLKEWPVVASIF